MPFCSGITAVSGPISGLMRCAGAFDVPQLDAEQHDIDLADPGGIVGGLGRHQMGLAAAALDPQPLGLHGGQMGAARDEGDLGARLGQRRAKSASDAAGADNRNTHGISLQIDMMLATTTRPLVQARIVRPAGSMRKGVILRQSVFFLTSEAQLAPPGQ